MKRLCIMILVAIPMVIGMSVFGAPDVMKAQECETNGNSYGPAISANAQYVAFQSASSSLVPGDTNGTDDFFVYNRQSHEISRVPVDIDGIQTNNYQVFSIISANGRLVVFNSGETSLVPEDTNGAIDVFVHDRWTGITSRVSVASDGTQGNHSSYYGSITPDGRYVSFVSEASNLVPGDTNSTIDAFVHDRQTGVTTRVSIASSGAEANSISSTPILSSDGRYVTFTSLADNLVPGDTNQPGPTRSSDIFVHDRQTGVTSRVSVASDGSEANHASSLSTISSDGRYVSFVSEASNLVPGDTNAKTDVFVHDRQTGITGRVSIASDGTEANHYSTHPKLSSDGRYVSFDSLASNLVPEDENNFMDVFVHDRETGITSRISIASNGAEANNYSMHSMLSMDGRYVSFESYANNLVSEDGDAWMDIFVHDRESGITELISMPSGCSVNPTPTSMISGRIIDGNGNPIEGVTLSTASGSNTTNVSGYYTFTNLMSGTYVLTPLKGGYTFTPISQSVSIPPDASGVNFTGTHTDTDTDGDGLLDDWEINGYDHNNDGVIDVDLPAMGSNWLHKDIFLEIDYMVQDGPCPIPNVCLRVEKSFRPRHLAIHNMVMAFHNAPVTNPDNTTGIHLHIDYGVDSPLVWGNGATWENLSRSNRLPYSRYIAQSTDDFGWDSRFFPLVNFSEARRHIFHYALFADRLVPPNDPNFDVVGLSLNDGDVVATQAPGQYILMTPGTTYQDISVTGLLMHELGHNLQLGHGGGDNIKHKPNYLSIMNYSFAGSGLILNGKSGNYDFSVFDQINTLEEFDLDETIGVTSASGEPLSNFSTAFFCNSQPQIFVLGGAIDWDCDSSIESSVATDITGDGPTLGSLESYNDWQHIDLAGDYFTGGCIGTVGDCPPTDRLNAQNIAVNAARTGIFEEPLPEIDTPHKIILPLDTTFIISDSASTNISVGITNGGTDAVHVSLLYATDSEVFSLGDLPSQIFIQAGETTVIPIGVEADIQIITEEYLTITATIVENINWVNQATFGVVKLLDGNVFLPIVMR